MSEPYSVQLARLHAQADDAAQPPVDDANFSESSSSVTPAFATTNSGSRRQPLDLSSESAFPSLGASSAPRATPAWGSGSAGRIKDAPTGLMAVSATNGGPRTKPSFAPSTASSAAAQASRNGMVTEVFDLPQAQQVTKTLGAKGTTAELVKMVKIKTNTEINLSVSRTGTITFLVKGKVEDVARAKREVMAALATKVIVISIDLDV